MHEIVIRGGSVIDGTGAPAATADVAIADGRIVAVGDLAGASARREIDADGAVVCPGFVDIHTHYDAQTMWDGSASPSVLHGVTSVVGGNCGFGLAPVQPGDGEYLARMLSRVEGMPLAALEAGVPFTWTSFGEWLGHLEGRLAVNAGFLAGHSTIRRFVMGPRVADAASDGDVAAMVEALERSLDAGALGFSTSLSPTHSGVDGRPVPSRRADTDELVSLARVLRRYEGSLLEMIPGVISPLDDGAEALMRAMSAAAERPVNWNLLKVSSLDDTWRRSLDRCGYDAATGSDVVALSLPELNSLSICIGEGFLFDAIDGWSEVMALPPEQRVAQLAEPEVRRRLQAGADATAARPTGRVGLIASCRPLRIAEVASPEWTWAVGRTIGEVADETRATPLDVLLDIAVADLGARLICPDLGDDDESWALRAQTWQRDEVVVGGSDAGAHLDVMCGATYTTALLGDGVRERGLLPIETAVHLMAQIPARLYGLRGRGSLAPGAWADVVVFDPRRVGGEVPVTRHDLPGGAARLYAAAQGVQAVIVNGERVVAEGELTGAAPGRVLRRGEATATRRPGTWRSSPVAV